MTDMPENPDDDRDAQSDNQSDTRRGVLRSVGLLGAGLGAGLLGRPLADDLAAPDEPIRNVQVNEDSSITIYLAENPEVADVHVVGEESIGAVASWHRIPRPNPLVSGPLDPGKYRVLARRGASNPEVVQEVTFEVSR